MHVRLFAAAVVLFIAASPVLARSVHKEFVQLWQEREASYRAQAPDLTTRTQASAKLAVASINNAAVTAPEDLTAALRLTDELATLEGRGIMLWEFLRHMERKPSAGLSEAWLQTQADQLRSDAQKIEELDTRVRFTTPHQVGLVIWIAALERLVMDRGRLAGKSRELTLIDENLDSYYRELGQEQQRNREARRVFFTAFAAGMAQQQQSFQNWTVTCIPNAIGTTCRGN